MITPEQKKNILIMAGILLLGIVIFVVVFLLPKKGPQGNTQMASTPTPAAPAAPTAPAKPSAPAGAAPGTPPAASPGGPASHTPPATKPSTPPTPPVRPSAPSAPPNAHPAGKLPAGLPPGRPGTPVASLPKTGVKGMVEKPKVMLPPVVLPTMGGTSVVGALVDPFANGPKPPAIIIPKKKKVIIVKPPASWDTQENDSIYTARLKKDEPPVVNGEIRMAAMPFMHATMGKPTAWAREPRTTVDLTPPPGRNAGYIYTENGLAYAIFEDATTHTAQAVKVGDAVGDYVVKAIQTNYIVLMDRNNREYKLKLQPVEASPWPDATNTNVDALGDAPHGAPPRWGR